MTLRVEWYAAGQTDLDRGIGPEAKEILQASVEHAYRTFVKNVADARKRRRAPAV